MAMLLVRCSAVMITLAAVLADPAELKDNILFYMPSLHISPNYNIIEYLGYELVHYGYLRSNCEGKGYTHEQITSENNLFMWKRDKDLKKVTNIFYEYYILPEEENGLMLWYMLLRFIEDYQFFNPVNGEYVLQKMRRCENTEVCEHRLPSRPGDLSFTDKQCRMSKTYLNELRFRLYKESSDPIECPLPFDYYFLGLYLLTNLPVSSSDINDIDPKEKLFEFNYYLKLAFEKGERFCMERFVIFLWFREKRQQFLQADLDDATDPEVKNKIEKHLTFHKTVTNMMLHGWMIFKEVKPTDGKLELFDEKGKRYVYDVPEIEL